MVELPPAMVGDIDHVHPMGDRALGVLAGATLGARLLVRFRSGTVRRIFIVVLVIVAVQMFLKGMGVSI